MAMASMAAVRWRWWCVLVVLCQHGDRLRERHTPSERTPSLPRMNHPKTAQLFGHVERGGSRPTGRTFSARACRKTRFKIRPLPPADIRPKEG